MKSNCCCESPSLDYNITKGAVSTVDKPKNVWSVKQKRCYSRILCGLDFADIRGDAVRFMTLTTSRSGSGCDLKRDLQVLVKRIRRKYGKFDYLRVRTSEGYGVLHIVYVGSFISQRWLSRVWCDIHKSPIVDIRAVKRFGKRFARYVVSQYLSSQGSNFIRYSWSFGWLYPGAIGDYYFIRSRFKPKYWYNVWLKALRHPNWRVSDCFNTKPPPLSVVHSDGSYSLVPRGDAVFNGVDVVRTDYVKSVLDLYCSGYGSLPDGCSVRYLYCFRLNRLMPIDSAAVRSVDGWLCDCSRMSGLDSSFHEEVIL